MQTQMTYVCRNKDGNGYKTNTTTCKHINKQTKQIEEKLRQNHITENIENICYIEWYALAKAVYTKSVWNPYTL